MCFGVSRLRSVCLSASFQQWRRPRPISTKASRRRRSSPTIAGLVTSRRGGWPTGGAVPASPASSSNTIRRAKTRPLRSQPTSWGRAAVRRRRRRVGLSRLLPLTATERPLNLRPRRRGRRENPIRRRLAPGGKDRNRRPLAGTARSRPCNHLRRLSRSRPRPGRPLRKARLQFPARARPRRRTPIPAKTRRSRATIFPTEERLDSRLKKDLPDPLRLCRLERRLRPARRLRSRALLPRPPARRTLPPRSRRLRPRSALRATG